VSKIISKEQISGWGNFPKFIAKVIKPESVEELFDYVTDEDHSLIARGGKTSYGDASLNNHGLNVDMAYFDKIISFSSETGILNCQSGVKLFDIIKTFHDEGWFLNVTPGTQRATVGGCIACDSHGKNWKAGSFCNYVIGFNIMIENGKIIWCDKHNNADLFYATFGGIGLTGILIDVKIRLKKVPSSFLNVETIRFRNLDELFQIQEQTVGTHEYLFSWIDSQKSGKQMGRGVMQRANHCNNEPLQYIEKNKINIPFNFPNIAINKLSVKIFNFVYYLLRNHKNSKKEYLLDFFYPLDGISNWNRVYGTKGFIEYQVVIPSEFAFKTIDQLLDIITKSGLGSTIAAIKPLTKSKGYLSFPIDGITLAVDFAYNNKLWEIMDRLDDIVINNGGRVYLAKDSRLNSTNFAKMYSESFIKFCSVINKYSVNRKFNSEMFHRISQKTNY